jgi:hypothetical protein
MKHIILKTIRRFENRKVAAYARRVSDGFLFISGENYDTLDIRIVSKDVRGQGPPQRSGPSRDQY